MSLSCSKKSLSEYRQLSPPFKALRDLTRAFSVSLSNHFSTKEREWDFLRIHEHIPGFRLWSDYILFRKCPDNHTQHLQLTKKVWNSQVPMHSHVPETFMSLLMAKHFPQWSFPILSPLSGTIKLVRSHFVLLIAFTYFISLSLIPGTSFLIYLSSSSPILSSARPPSFPHGVTTSCAVFLLWVAISSFCASGHF